MGPANFPHYLVKCPVAANVKLYWEPWAMDSMNIPNTNCLKKCRKYLQVRSLIGRLMVPSFSFSSWEGDPWFSFLPLKSLCDCLCYVMFFTYMNHGCSCKTLLQFLFIIFPEYYWNQKCTGLVQAAHFFYFSLILRIFRFYRCVQGEPYCFVCLFVFCPPPPSQMSMQDILRGILVLFLGSSWVVAGWRYDIRAMYRSHKGLAHFQQFWPENATGNTLFLPYLSRTWVLDILLTCHFNSDLHPPGLFALLSLQYSQTLTSRVI